MKPRHAAALVLRPLLITLAILGIAYLVGGPGLFTPSGFLGFVIVTLVVGIAILCGLGAIDYEYKHVNATAALHRGLRHPHHSFRTPVDTTPPMPFYVGGGSIPGYNARPDTPDKVLRFTRRVFRDRARF